MELNAVRSCLLAGESCFSKIAYNGFYLLFRHFNGLEAHHGHCRRGTPRVLALVEN